MHVFCEYATYLENKISRGRVNNRREVKLDKDT